MQENNGVPHNATISTSTPATGARSKKYGDKRNWFHSLTRRRKTSLSESSLETAAEELRLPTQHQNLNNNNNDDATRTATTFGSTLQTANDESSRSRHKAEKSAFQRFKQKMSLHMLSLRRRKRREAETGATTDASAEFVTSSPTRDPQLLPLTHSNINSSNPVCAEGHELVPFTLHYKRFVAKKWLERDAEPNQIMYKASSEMLGQVWYWGEISRRDAQKQLTDKPTGSFLVRDSETSGSQFTLSFRIVNVTLHYRLEYRDSYWHFEELQYESIVEMIEDILFRCTNDNFVCFVRVPNEMQPPFPVILKYPLSRYLKMPQLQDLCRRVIQRHNTKDEIPKLPIPPKLQEYLSEQRELVF